MSASRETCSGCPAPRDRRGQRYCRSCHNAYERRWKADQKAQLDFLRKAAKAELLNSFRLSRENEALRARLAQKAAA